MSKVPKITSLQYLKENVKYEVFVDKHQRFLQNDIILGACVVRHAQITQNNKFRGVQFLSFYKMTKIRTPPPPLLAPA